MGRRTSIFGALVRAHNQSIRTANARTREAIALEKRIHQANAAASRAAAAEIQRAEAHERRQHSQRMRTEKEIERERERARKNEQQRMQDEAVQRAELATLEAVETISALQSILHATLTVDDTVDFRGLLVMDPPPALELPELKVKSFEPPILPQPPKPPGLAEYIAKVKPITWQEKLLGRQSRFERECARASIEHDISHQVWQAKCEEQAREIESSRQTYLHSVERARSAHATHIEALRRQHAIALQVYEEKRAQRAAEVYALESSYRAGEAESVEIYNEMVLQRSIYPAGLPQQFRLAYQPESRQLVIDYELPSLEIVPTVIEYKYVRSRAAIERKERKPAEIRGIYRDLVAQIAIRTLHEIFEADQAGAVETVVFSGYVNRINAATGREERPYLISVRSQKEEFSKLNLERVDPQVCLRNIGARISPHPEEAQAVKPILEFDMVDRRFVDQHDALSDLDDRPNLMDLTPAQFENVVSNLFTRMGLETKLTRSSRDGGVDAVAFDTRPVLGGKVVIQAKRYRHTVGVSAVRDLYGTMMNEGASKGIMVSTSGYGPDTYAFAKDKPLELIDGGGLLYLLESVGVHARIIMPIENT